MRSVVNSCHKRSTPRIRGLSGCSGKCRPRLFGALEHTNCIHLVKAPLDQPNQRAGFYNYGTQRCILAGEYSRTQSLQRQCPKARSLMQDRVQPATSCRTHNSKVNIRLRCTVLADTTFLRSGHSRGCSYQARQRVRDIQSHIRGRIFFGRLLYRGCMVITCLHFKDRVYRYW